MHTSEVVSIFNSLHAFSRLLLHPQGGKSKDELSEDYRILELTKQIQDIKYGVVYCIVYSSVHSLGWYTAI